MGEMKTGRIYALKSFQNELIYVGSTTKKLKYRFTQHKYDYKRWLNGKIN